MPITAAVVQDIAGHHPLGISIDLANGRVLTGVGFCVAYEETQGNFGYTGLKVSMQHAQGATGSQIIGAWSHGGNIYYDSVKKYSTRIAAVEAAKKENQLAIYNLSTQMVETIRTDAGSFNPSLQVAQARKRSHSF